MAFNGYQQYLKDQRRARRWEIALPIFIVAVLLLILAILFHGAYVRSHAKPKPAAAEVTFYDVQSGYEPGHVIGKPGTVWIKCSAGMDVTNLADCPEYKHTKWAAWSDWAKKNIYLAPCKEGDSTWWDHDDDVAKCVKASPKLHKRKHYRGSYGTSGGGWLVKQANIDPSPSTYIFDKCESLGGSSGPGYSQTTFTCDGIDVQMNWGKAPKAEAKVPGITWSTTPLPAEPYNPFAHDGDMGSHGLPTNGSECVGFKGFHYSEAAHGCLEDGYPCFKDCGPDYYMPHFIPCPAGATCTPVEQTTPQDITNLMEQIAPTPTQYICRKAGECFPKCDSPLTPSITRACYQITYGGKNILILPSNYAHGFTCPDEFESCGVVNSTIYVPHEHQPIVEWHINPPAKPDCRMPADIDVCPQTVDPKGSHD